MFQCKAHDAISNNYLSVYGQINNVDKYDKVISSNYTHILRNCLKHVMEALT